MSTHNEKKNQSDTQAKNQSKKKPLKIVQSSQKKRIKVGDIKSYVIKASGRKNPVFYSYGDVEYDIDGWADVTRFLPNDFDLVFLRLKRERTIPGWINGQSFEGRKLKPDDVVLFWKRKEELDELT